MTTSLLSNELSISDLYKFVSEFIKIYSKFDIKQETKHIRNDIVDITGEIFLMKDDETKSLHIKYGNNEYVPITFVISDKYKIYNINDIRKLEKLFNMEFTDEMIMKTLVSIL